MFSCNLSKYLNKNVFSGSNDLFLKVLFYASFCLLACIVQPGTATADEKKMFESVQEIGTLILEDYEVPYLTAFAAATESLYVLAEGKLIQYHLKPLEKINSFDVGFKIPPGRIDTVINGKHRVNWPTHAQIFITNDETKLIIYTGKELKLLDLDKRQIVKTVSLDFYGELNKRAVLNGDELAIFDDGNRITIWNSNSLKQIKQFNSYPWSKQGPHLIQGVSSLNKIGDWIFLFREFGHYNSELIVFDSETYSVKHTLSGVGDNPALSYDFKTLYLQGIEQINFQGKYLSFNERIDISYDLINGQFKRLATSPNNYQRWTFPNKMISLGKFRQVVGVKNNLYTKYQKIFTYKDVVSTKGLAVFGDGEAILYRPKTKNFQATKNARKHLMMKTLKGDIAPINDITFDKHNKTGISPKEW